MPRMPGPVSMKRISARPSDNPVCTVKAKVSGWARSSGQSTIAWQALTTARSNIASISDAVRANEIALDGSRQEALVGQRTTLDVLDTERDLFSSQVDLVAARRDEVVASYRVKAAVGELTVTGIDLSVEPYNPEFYYDNVRNRWFGLGDDPNEQRAE